MDCYRRIDGLKCDGIFLLSLSKSILWIFQSRRTSNAHGNRYKLVCILSLLRSCIGVYIMHMTLHDSLYMYIIIVRSSDSFFVSKKFIKDAPGVYKMMLNLRWTGLMRFVFGFLAGRIVYKEYIFPIYFRYLCVASDCLKSFQITPVVYVVYFGYIYVMRFNLYLIDAFFFWVSW